jgi:hypothetical protein
MTIYGGLGLGTLSPVAYAGNTVGGTSSRKEVDTKPSSGTSVGVSTAHYEPAVSSGSSGKKVSDSDGTHMPEYPTKVDVGGGYSDGYAQPKKEQDTTNNVDPVPEPPQEKQLDVKKLLEGTHNEGYKIYPDGKGGFTLDPNSEGGVYYGPGSVKTTAPKAKKQTATAALPEVSQIYTMDGDDYSIDNTAFANAQRGTGEDQAAASIAGGSGGGSKRNSNVNDAIFGGESNKATPGYSLW